MIKLKKFLFFLSINFSMENNINIPEINNSINEIDNNDYVKNNVEILEEYRNIINIDLNGWSIQNNIKNILKEFQKLLTLKDNSESESYILNLEKLTDINTNLKKYIDEYFNKNSNNDIYYKYINNKDYIRDLSSEKKIIDSIVEIINEININIQIINNYIEENISLIDFENIEDDEDKEDIKNKIQKLKKELLENETVELKGRFKIKFKKHLTEDNFNRIINIIDATNNMKNNIFTNIFSKNEFEIRINEITDNLLNLQSHLKNHFEENKIIIQNLKKKAFMQMSELYKNIYWFLFNKSYNYSSNNFDTSIIEECFYEIDKINMENFIKKKNIIKNTSSYNYFVYNIGSNINNLYNDTESNLIWDFKTFENLFTEIKDYDFKNEVFTYLIENTGGAEIIIPHNGHNFITSGNCLIHTIINYIIGALHIFEEKISNINLKIKMKEKIFDNLIDFTKSDRRKQFEIFNHKDNKQYEKDLRKIFNFDFNKYKSNELADYDFLDEKFTDFFIEYYDYLVLLYKGGYNIKLNNNKIYIEFYSSDRSDNLIYQFYLNILNIKDELYLYKNTLFGRTNKSCQHIENIVYFNEKTLEKYTECLDKLNERRVDSKNQNTTKTFYYEITKL
jgi:hypothetical protein